MRTSLFAAVFKIPVIVFALLALMSGPLCAQFIDQSEMLGSPIVNPGSPHGDGISFYDFNYDGWDDLTVSNGSDDPRFYINNNGVLQPAEFTIENNSSENISMVLWADYDNDGDADLLLTKFGGPIQLFQNDGNFNFSDVAQSSGLMSGNFFHVGAAWADYDHDGCLDLYVAKFYHPDFFPDNDYSGRLYRNNCDGSFTDVTESSGVYLPPRPCFQPVFLDYNSDGWEDLLLVIDRHLWPNELFKNNGDGTFTQITATAGWEFNFDAMSGTVGDFDNDADLDIYLTNNPYYNFGTVLMENNGDETFTNTASENGVEMFQVTWGSMWLDYDNDSWLDLFTSVTSPVLEPIGNQFFVNNSGSGFVLQNELVGIAEDPSETFVCAMGDLNNDGYYDFALNNRFPHAAKLYFNDGGENHYLSVSLEGTVSNIDGIGTWIHCFAGGKEYIRYTLSGENLIGQNSRKIIFGLESVESIDSLIIKWNRGTEETYYDVSIDTHHHYIEGMSLSMPFAIEIMGSEWLCPGDSVVLDGGDYESHLWSDGSEERYLTVTQPGPYQVLVTNEFGIEIESLPINIESAPNTEIEWSVDHVSCFGAADGSIFLDVSTGPLDSILWSTGAQIPFVENLGPGMYHFEAVDIYGCTVSDSTAVVEPDALIAANEISDVLCFGENSGSASITFSGGTAPYFTEWGGQNNNALYAGDYTIIFTDLNGCADSVSFVIDQPDSLYCLLSLTDQIGDTGGSAEIEILGGTPPFEINWSTGAMNIETINNLEAGEYSVVVADDNNCSAGFYFSIDLVSGFRNLSKPAISLFPNPSTHTIILSGCENTILDLMVTDLTGKTLLEFNQYNCNRPLDISELFSGVYILRIAGVEKSLLFVKH